MRDHHTNRQTASRPCTHRLSPLDVVICVAGEAAAEARDAGAGGGLGHDHGLPPLHRGHIVPLCVLVHSLLSVASVCHLLQRKCNIINLFQIM